MTQCVCMDGCMCVFIYTKMFMYEWMCVYVYVDKNILSTKNNGGVRNYTLKCLAKKETKNDSR